MGTVIDRVGLACPRWRDRHSALHLAVTAASDCLRRAGCDADELDLIVNEEQSSHGAVLCTCEAKISAIGKVFTNGNLAGRTD